MPHTRKALDWSPLGAGGAKEVCCRLYDELSSLTATALWVKGLAACSAQKVAGGRLVGVMLGPRPQAPGARQMHRNVLWHFHPGVGTTADAEAKPLGGTQVTAGLGVGVTGLTQAGAGAGGGGAGIEEAGVLGAGRRPSCQGLYRGGGAEGPLHRGQPVP